ncbi:hypothetical protein, partial [Kribbia dieselivorans]|uniref:hypothetical protein n=1 Tax=Kribbia dieselivorans TaxID=331526 RepID=UPI001C3F355B
MESRAKVVERADTGSVGVRGVGAGEGGVPLSLDEAMTNALIVVAVLLAGWLLLGYLVALLGALPGGVGRLCDGLSQRYSPTFARRMAAITLSVGGAGLALAGPA